MRKNQVKKLAASVAAALLSTTMLSGCSMIGQAPTVASEESSLHHDTDESSSPVSGSESSKAAHSDSASGSRLADILERGYIEVATEPYFAPNEFIDPSKQGNDKYVGADIELARYIADKLGVECRIVPLDFESVLSGITEGKYDMAISALAYTPARAEAMELSNGYYFDDEKIEYGLMVRTENLDQIRNADDLADKTIVVQSGSLQEMFAGEQVPAYRELKRVSATTDGFLMVQEGKADAVITSITTAQLYIDANSGCDMTIVPDFAFTVDESTQGTRIGITKGETELLNKVNEIIDGVVEEGVYSRWYEEYKEYARSLGL
ncbi:transporter substrate-binding domain-containing protein [[Clostridium] symbiosum]|uniref:substrate-binding periplasmic protein n=1 Tax=Clostridium symbiosum TaxID=1512 RepID=UPI001D08A366|nr:transporter substrate-binding domain-containing protein [[Clostridium] symbiosum]MCB6608497.1 transporter substrate-binding domain-containing protein [[Clostridium] symbiosum]MCB6932191.1 transporter substrate-binding domain-containing protein [[Clostridium] symbiosum]